MEYHYALTGTHRVRGFCICTILSGGSPFKGPVSSSHDPAHPGGWFASWHSLAQPDPVPVLPGVEPAFLQGPCLFAKQLGMVLEVKVCVRRALIARGVTVATLDFNKQS